MQKELFKKHSVRVWRNGKSEVFLPSENYDVVFVFAHILQHYFGGGIGLRQICDWCRLLWRFKDKLDYGLLESRIRKAGILTEWKAFAALAVDYLEMPSEAMPMYSPDDKWKRKADKICAFVMEVGNFGHNRDMIYLSDSPFLIRKVISVWRSTLDGFKQFCVFPIDSARVWGKKMAKGILKLSKGN